MNLEKIKFDAIRFFGSGMKRHWFTKNLYEAFHCYSNKFIAHYDINGFYQARFGSAEAIRETARMLDTTGNDVLKILRDVFFQYGDSVRAVGESKELVEMNAYLNELITKSYFIPSRHRETREEVKQALIKIQNQIQNLIESERA